LRLRVREVFVREKCAKELCAKDDVMRLFGIQSAFILHANACARNNALVSVFICKPTLPLDPELHSAFSLASVSLFLKKKKKKKKIKPKQRSTTHMPFAPSAKGQGSVYI
jgi:hypothetical protein